jgi:hypothetical protein
MNQHDTGQKFSLSLSVGVVSSAVPRSDTGGRKKKPQTRSTSVVSDVPGSKMIVIMITERGQMSHSLVVPRVTQRQYVQWRPLQHYTTPPPLKPIYFPGQS